MSDTQPTAGKAGRTKHERLLGPSIGIALVLIMAMILIPMVNAMKSVVAVQSTYGVEVIDLVGERGIHGPYGVQIRSGDAEFTCELPSGAELEAKAPLQDCVQTIDAETVEIAAL